MQICRAMLAQSLQHRSLSGCQLFPQPLEVFGLTPYKFLDHNVDIIAIQLGLVLQLRVVPKFVGNPLHVVRYEIGGGDEAVQSLLGYFAPSVSELCLDEILPRLGWN